MPNTWLAGFLCATVLLGGIIVVLFGLLIRASIRAISQERYLKTSLRDSRLQVSDFESKCNTLEQAHTLAEGEAERLRTEKLRAWGIPDVL